MKINLFKTAVKLISDRAENNEFVSVRKTMIDLGVVPNRFDVISYDSDDQSIVLEAFNYLSVDNLEGPGLIDVAPGKGGKGDMAFAKSSLI